MQILHLLLQIILGISVVLFMGSVLVFIIVKGKLHLATYEVISILKKNYPEIRNLLGIRGTISNLYDSSDRVPSFIFRYYVQPYRLVKTFGSLIEVRNFYNTYLDIEAIILTKDTILMSKMESLFGLLQSMIRTLTISIVIFFIGLIVPQGLLKIFGF